MKPETKMPDLTALANWVLAGCPSPAILRLVGSEYSSPLQDEAMACLRDTLRGIAYGDGGRHDPYNLRREALNALESSREEEMIQVLQHAVLNPVLHQASFRTNIAAIDALSLYARAFPSPDSPALIEIVVADPSTI
jgi:hypothetical protein